MMLSRVDLPQATRGPTRQEGKPPTLTCSEMLSSACTLAASPCGKKKPLRNKTCSNKQVSPELHFSSSSLIDMKIERLNAAKISLFLPQGRFEKAREISGPRFS